MKPTKQAETDGDTVGTWRLVAHILFPCAPNPRPDRLEALSRIPVGRCTIGGVPIVVARADKEKPDLLHEWCVVLATARAQDPTAALQQGIPAVESLVESLAFQLQAHLAIDSLDVVEVTQPVAVGDWRDDLISPAPFGHPTIIFSPASQSLGMRTRLVPDLELDVTVLDARSARAFDWFLKALSATLEVDRFIFLWISAEILCGQSDLSVAKPFRADCGHEIASCPECGRSTSRKVQGETMKSYLQERLGVPEATASVAWRLRQMLHGAFDFDAEMMERVSDVSGKLHGCLINELKPRLGLNANDPPFLDPDSVTMWPGIQLVAQREIQAVDLME